MSDYLPQELWLEILYWLTPKSLVICTSVCKQWKSLITDPSFISEHGSRQTNNDNQRLLVRLCRKSGSNFIESFSLRLDDEKLDLLSPFEFPFQELFANRCSKVVGICNGLVCLADCRGHHGCDLVLWNPSIRKYVVIPTPDKTFNRLGFGFDSKNNDFKIVILSRAKGPTRVGVYSFTQGYWKIYHVESPLFNLCWMSYDTPLFNPLWDFDMSSVFLNGVLHWVVWHTCYFILTFDVAEETFGELMLPKSLSETKYAKSSVISVLGGGPSLVTVESSVPLSSKQWFNIWVMNEYGDVGSWTKVFSYESGIAIGINCNLSRPLCFRNCGEVLLQNPSGEIIATDPVTEKEKSLGIKGDGFAFAGYQVESLVLLDKKTNVLSY
ncbi:hypothetical protein L6164_006503 [Bauhinia variegata]|uniref:Uncharacterized protein n=1 Tax=Bauhinia variegata TaxID=167791 RepID=A0ACB9PV66_BAUVA|nr:hypothetical protein L6164_006503 [Bauhinia variegata]